MTQPTADSRLPTSGPRRGIAMAMALAALLAVMLVAGALIQSLLASHRQSKRYATELQAQWLAEAGLDRARAQLATNSDYVGETWPAGVGGAESEVGEVTIRIEPAAASSPGKLVVEAVYPPGEHDRILVRREMPLAPAGDNP